MINVTQISTTEATIVIVVLENIPYKRTFEDENQANAFLMKISELDGNKAEDIKRAKELLTDTLSPEVKEQRKKEQEAIAIRENYKRLYQFGIYEEDGYYFMIGGPKISMPKRLVDEFAVRIDSNEPTEPLMNFWKLCMLNPDKNARNDLFKFLQDSKMEITPAGLFVSYRNVNEKDTPANRSISEKSPAGYDALKDFVNTTFKNQRKRKKGTSRPVWLVKVGNGQEYQITKNEDQKPEGTIQLLGDLKEMHEKFATSDETTALAPPKVDTTEDRFKKIYTDDYTNKMEIRMFNEVRLPRENCDANNAIPCSRGLHTGTESFVRKNSFGNIGIKVLVNPRNVVAVPYSANTKMRVSAYFPFDFIEFDEKGSVITSDVKTFDYAYIDYDMNEMQKQIMELTIEELEHKIILPKEMTIGHFGNLVRNIADDIVRNRVIKIETN